MLVRATDVVIDRIKDSIEPMKKGVETTFDQLIKTVENWKDIENRRPKEDESSSLSSMVKKQTDDETQKKMDQVNGNSAISWIFEKFQNIADEVIEIKTPDPDLNLQNAVTEFFEGSFKTAWDELSKSFTNLQKIFSNAFKDDLPDVEDISIDWIFNKISYLIVNGLSEGLVAALGTIKNVVLRLFDLIQDLISFGKKLMFAEVRFPFIEKLLKLITGNSVNTQFKLIDAVALLAAVPLSIAHKIIFGKALINKGDIIAFPSEKTICVQNAVWEDWISLSTVTRFLWPLVFLLLIIIQNCGSISEAASKLKLLYIVRVIAILLIGFILVPQFFDVKNNEDKRIGQLASSAMILLMGFEGRLDDLQKPRFKSNFKCSKYH